MKSSAPATNRDTTNEEQQGHYSHGNAKYQSKTVTLDADITPQEPDYTTMPDEDRYLYLAALTPAEYDRVIEKKKPSR